MNFYPRPPRGGRQRGCKEWEKKENISIHALREEGDCDADLTDEQVQNFYPRPPRGGRRSALDTRQAAPGISIHALREEGDPDNTG